MQYAIIQQYSRGLLEEEFIGRNREAKETKFLMQFGKFSVLVGTVKNQHFEMEIFCGFYFFIRSETLEITFSARANCNS